jgi:hypothetical protein
LIRRLLAIVVLGATFAVPHARAADAISIDVLSNRPELISGGDALVSITSESTPVVELNGTDVSSLFASRETALVTGLRDGDNELVARAADVEAHVTITNHPIGGPVFSGPQVRPWLCETEGAGLGPATDEQCNAPTKVELLYRSTLFRSFRAYDPSNPPGDVATTTTDQGVEVPYIVRRETGTMNRAVYRFAVLYDPSTDSYAAWNGKLHYLFDGGAAPNHRQGSAPPDVMNDLSLSRGFATAAATLNVFGQNVNTVTSAETTMMLKEHVIETLGPVRYTESTGCSGGSVQQQEIAETYPGLLDGIIPSCSFPDVWTPATQFAAECGLLERYFTFTSPALWTIERQRAAVAGHLSNSSCVSVAEATGLDLTAFDPTVGCMGGTANPGGLTPEPAYVYDATTNPDGARCTLQDYQEAIFGARPPDRWGPVEQRVGHGFTNRAYDNTGVQYGLRALESGEILPEQFVDLNEKIGGRDIDYGWQPARSEADPLALERVYRSGQINSGKQMATVPILDLRGSSNYEFHLNFNTFVMRERLIQTNGHADNQVNWIGAYPLATDPTSANEAFLLVDRWLTSIEADGSDRPLAEKVVRDKPVDAVDTCWIVGLRITDTGLCRVLFPYFGDPRIAAGGPLSNDVLKCALRPMSRSDYAVAFTDAQWSRLQAAFPDGVCDWSTPSIGRQPSVPWLTYANGPGGEPLGIVP